MELLEVTDITFNYITAGIALLALLVSLYGVLEQRRRIGVYIRFINVEYCIDYFKVYVSVTNTGNKPYSVSKILFTIDGSKADGTSQVAYNADLNLNRSKLEPGETLSITGNCVGKISEKRWIEVILHGSKKFCKPFVLNLKYAGQWCSFMIFILSNNLKKYDIKYDDLFLSGARVMDSNNLVIRNFILSDKNNPSKKLFLNGNNPYIKKRPIAEIEKNEPLFQDYLDCSKTLVANMPDLFKIDNSISELGFSLKFQEEVFVRYSSNSGGQEYFRKYGFDPKLYDLPLRVYDTKGLLPRYFKDYE